MLKCPLCGWANEETAETCSACGAPLYLKNGLKRDADNPDCYTYTPARKLAQERGFTFGGSGIDLIYKFASDRLIILLVFFKILIFSMTVFEVVYLYANSRTQPNVLIPILILYLISIIGWIMVCRGGRTKNRTLLHRGMNLLYSYYIVMIAYMLLSVAVILYFSVATYSGNYLVSSRIAFIDIVKIVASMAVVLVFFGSWFGFCRGFFKSAMDMLDKNRVKYYRFTPVLPVLFFIGAAAGIVLSVLIVLDEPIQALLRSFTVVDGFFYYNLMSENVVMRLFIIAAVLTWITGGAICLNFIKSYRNMFVKYE